MLRPRHLVLLHDGYFLMVRHSEVMQLRRGHLLMVRHGQIHILVPRHGKVVLLRRAHLWCCRHLLHAATCCIRRRPGPIRHGPAASGPAAAAAAAHNAAFPGLGRPGQLKSGRVKCGWALQACGVLPAVPLHRRVLSRRRRCDRRKNLASARDVRATHGCQGHYEGKVSARGECQCCEGQ